MPEHLLEVRNLSVDFHTSHGTVHAVRNVSWHLDRGETLAILGESGSGKSVSASAIMDLIDCPPGEIVAGEIHFDGRNLLELHEAERRALNGHRIAMIFQDPLSHLNPVYSVGFQIAETMIAHGQPRAGTRARTIELLARVGIPEPEKKVDSYPHQFSGGQRQRIMIAMALAMEPEILIADEPTTALDVTVQAQILALLEELQRETGMGLLLITHDLGVVAEVADRVVVMNAGRDRRDRQCGGGLSQPCPSLHEEAHRRRARIGRIGPAPERDSATPARHPGTLEILSCVQGA